MEKERNLENKNAMGKFTLDRADKTHKKVAHFGHKLFLYHKIEFFPLLERKGCLLVLLLPHEPVLDQKSVSTISVPQ